MTEAGCPAADGASGMGMDFLFLFLICCRMAMESFLEKTKQNRKRRKTLDGHYNTQVKLTSFSEGAEGSLGIAPGKWFWDTGGFQSVHVNACSEATAGQQLCYSI